MEAYQMYLGLKISDWIMIIAVFLGPIVAVRLTRYLDNKNEIKNRKLELFRTLMSTRAYSISWEHVSALNRIDVEFVKIKAHQQLSETTQYNIEVDKLSRNIVRQKVNELNYALVD